VRWRLTRRGRLLVAVVAGVAVVASVGLASDLGRSAPPAVGEAAPAAGPAAEEVLLAAVPVRSDQLAGLGPADLPFGSAAGFAPGTDGASAGTATTATTRGPAPVDPDAVAPTGEGTFRDAGSRLPSREATGRVLRYRVLVEDGITVDGTALEPADAADFAAEVHRILDHPRGWQRIDGLRFRQVGPEDDGPVAMTVHLASPGTVDVRCYPLLTYGEVSCAVGASTYLNARRWFASAETYGDRLQAYRTYLVSHEVGHVLGRGHDVCPAPGAPAPVMVQQTKSLGGCRPSPWPAPPQ
jgi:hypothetical protein